MNYQHVPQELKDRRQWVVWKDVDGRKVPFQVTGMPAKSNDPSTWTTFDAAASAPGDWSGIGYMFAADDPFVGIDLDGCRDPKTKQTTKWAKDVLELCGSYAELSPSQTGWKIFAIGQNPYDTGKNAKLNDDKKFPKVSHKDPGIEVYDKLRWFAVTGVRGGGMGILRELDEIAYRVIKDLIDQPQPVQQTAPAIPMPSEVADRAAKYVAKMDAAVSGQNGHKSTFAVACVLALGFSLPEPEAWQILNEYNQRCDPPWTERELRHKLDDAYRATGERGYLLDQRGVWATRRPDEPDTVVEIVKHSEAVCTTLEKAVEAYISRVEQGQRPLIKTGIATLDDALGGGIDTGEMVILAARPSHGKSLVGLQLIHNLTKAQHTVIMFSEEMQAELLGKRTIQFATPLEEADWQQQSEVLRAKMKDHFDERATCYVVENMRHVSKIAKYVEQNIGNTGATAIVVDYAQILDAKGNNEMERVSMVSRTLKGVASKHNLIVVLMCQLNRAIEGEKDRAPRYSDLRNSGQLEQDADVIVFLKWMCRVDEKADPSEYRMYVAKNRNREIKNPVVNCNIDPSRQTIIGNRIPTDSKQWTPLERSTLRQCADDFAEFGPEF